MGNANNKWIGIGFALMAVAFWSGNFVVARGLSESIHPFALSFFRWLTASLVFTPFALRFVKRDWKIIRSNVPYLVLVGVLGVSLFNTLIYFAGRSSEATNLALIMLTFPIFIMLISSVVFKEKITWLKMLGLIIVLSGVITIISKGQLSVLTNLSFKPGDPLMLLAALTFAIHSILLKKKPEGLSIISLQYSTFVIGMLVLFPFFLFAWKAGNELAFNSNVITGILYVGVCASLISFTSWNKALEKIGPSASGMIYFLMPLFGGFAAWLILGEQLKYYHLISGVLIVSGIMVSNIKASPLKSK
jgi:drug/metabolite transporter (DMT)-like permease